jgi:hypothetical protein
MTYFHPAWVEHQRKRYTRADAYRFAAPGTPEARMPGWLDPSATRVRWKEAQEEEARLREAARQEELERDLLELRWLVKSLRTDLLMRDLRHKYDPDQPRVPAGSPQGGQWTSGGGGGGDGGAVDTQGESGSGEVLSDASPDPIRAGDQFANVIPICMLSSRGITIDDAGNKFWRAEYVCADGFSFWKSGTGSSIRAFWVDPRR